MLGWIRKNWWALSWVIFLAISLVFLNFYAPAYFALIIQALPTALCWTSILLVAFIIFLYFDYRRRK